MSYFLRPHLISLLEARENRFSTEERANFDQFHRKIYIIAEALPVVDVGVALLLLLPPYGPPPPPVVVEEPQAAMRSARARLIAEKRIVLECFICWILLCCFPGSICGYNNDEVGHHGSLEERNAEMCFCCHVSPHTYTQKGYTRHRQSACSSQNTSACAKSILRCWASSLAWLGEGKSGRPSRLLRARGTLEELTCTPPWGGTLSGFSEKPLAQHAAERPAVAWFATWPICTCSKGKSAWQKRSWKSISHVMRNEMP
jgi:hypothetical protein